MIGHHDPNGKFVVNSIAVKWFAQKVDFSCSSACEAGESIKPGAPAPGKERFCAQPAKRAKA
jgi:hypothetical protein